MDEATRAEYLRKGAVETTVQEFLGLDDAEMRVVELRVRIGREVRRRREQSGLSQAALAGRIGVSQPRIPAIEGGTAAASLDRVILAYFAAGGTPAELAAVVAGTP